MAAVTVRASADDDPDDSVDPAELVAATGGGISFVVLGAPDEEVEVTLMRPSSAILTVVVVVGPSCSVRVECPSAAGGCRQAAG